MREFQFDTEEYYHVYNRGVDKRDIFCSTDEYRRFYESLYLFNDKSYKRHAGDQLDRLVLLAGSEVFSYDRDVLVSIVAYKMMTNHYHLVLRQEQDDGISEFMHRLGTGYTNFFNFKHKRSGSLFEGPFGAVHIKNDAQLEHSIRYAHLNELDRYGLLWRDGLVENWEKALELLDVDSYSSHGVYCGREQELPAVDFEIAHGLFPDPKEYREFLRSWSQSSMNDLPEGTPHELS